MRQVATSRLPIDLRVIMAFGIASCVIDFGLITLLITGVARIPEDAHNRVFFDTISLSSELAHGMYSFSLGLCRIVSVYGLFRRTRWAWWYTLAFMSYGVADSAFGLTSVPVVAATSMLLSAGVIVWLVCRRQLFWHNR
jgi:hypothetical protein